MNPRLFCREQSFHKCLFLTYSFDPNFFEQVILPDLWAGRSSDILVLADQTQIDTSVQAANGQLLHLGRHYLLAGAKHTGAFHPKVFLRFSPKDGLVMVGSGNVTSSGWGGNQELGAAWMVGPEHADKGGWLHPFLDDVMSWCGSELEHDAVRRMKDVPWLSLTPIAPASESVVLHSRSDISLSSSLAQRWVGRQFDEVNIFTGSTDESGAFLRWAHSTFGVKRATVVLTPSSASFVPGKLGDLPLELRIIPATGDRSMHAKLYWFDGPGGAAAVMGSANCSAAAWLLSPKHGGNIETLVAYDRPNRDDFKDVLSVFMAPAFEPVDALLPKSTSVIVPDTNLPAFRLKTLLWDGTSRHLHAEISPAPELNMTIHLHVGNLQLPMECIDGKIGSWRCVFPESLATTTVFAYAQISDGNKQWKTQPRWINDVAALEQASHSARLLEPFKGLERNATSTEQRQMLDELQEVAQALFNDTTAFRDPGFSSRHTDKAKDDIPAAPVNPADLIVHLGESQNNIPNFDSSGSGSLSLTGILRLLFDADPDDSTSSPANDEKTDEGQIDDDENKVASKKDQDKTGGNFNHPQIEDRFRDRLAEQIATFLCEMASPAFAERCSATQMVQAISFPLAVALRGQNRGWVKPEMAENWALGIFSILFRGHTTRAGGLLHEVEQRYALNNQHQTFYEVVGDGTLWIVLVATLGNTVWRGVGTDIDKAIALREVFTSQQLLASATPTRISSLVGKIRIDDAHAYIAEVAPSATRLLNEIEGNLHQIWENEATQQNERAITHKPGDLLWRENIGWAICLDGVTAKIGQPVKVRLRGVEKNVMNGYYVNVSELASRNSNLEDLITRLRLSVTSRMQDSDTRMVNQV